MKALLDMGSVSAHSCCAPRMESAFGGWLGWRAVAVMMALVTTLFVTEAIAQEIPVGAHEFVFDNRGESLKVATYKPPTYDGGPILLVAHGSGRNADEYRNYAIAMAERFGVLAIVPEFDWARFDNERWKRNGGVTRDGVVQPRAEWTYDIIDRLVDHVREREGADLPYYMIGHSGGAQLIVRMALFMPEGPERFVSANSGSYTFLDRGVPYPYGLGGLPDALTDDEALQRYLAAPLVLFLGSGDTRTGAEVYGDTERMARFRARLENIRVDGRPLTPAQIEERLVDGFDNSDEANAQGLHRFSRGRNFFETSRQLAESRGWTFNWRVVVTEGVGHSGANMFRASEVEEALFGPDPVSER